MILSFACVSFYIHWRLIWLTVYLSFSCHSFLLGLDVVDWLYVALFACFLCVVVKILVVCWLLVAGCCCLLLSSLLLLLLLFVVVVVVLFARCCSLLLMLVRCSLPSSRCWVLFFELLGRLYSDSIQKERDQWRSNFKLPSVTNVISFWWWYCWWTKKTLHHLGCIKPYK